MVMVQKAVRPLRYDVISLAILAFECQGLRSADAFLESLNRLCRLNLLSVFSEKIHLFGIRSAMSTTSTANWQQIAVQLESYMTDLDDITQRWQAWLEESESQSRPTLLESEATERFRLEGSALIDEFKRLVTLREQLLAEAHHLGWRGTTLRTLGEWLPNFNPMWVRSAFETARQNLEQLRRLHVATWVALRQSADYCQDTLEIVMSGGIRSDVTIDRRQPDSGGQLLDTSL